VAAGGFYMKRGAYPAAANRLDGAVNQFPLYSGSDEALLKAGEAYMAMDKKRFRQQAISDFSRIVRDYPGNPKIVEQAKRHLNDLEAPVPETNPEALALLKYNQEHYVKPSLVHREIGVFITGAPDMSHSSKKGEPTMTAVKSSIPVSVPVPAEATAVGAGAAGTGTNDVSVQQLNGESKLDSAPDARKSAAATDAPVVTGPAPSNHQKDIEAAQAEQAKRAKKNKKKTTAQPASAPATNPAQPASTDPSAPATPATGQAQAPTQTPPAQPPPQQ
jgi:hypothetical protein